jgi:hypothetical protein
MHMSEVSEGEKGHTRSMPLGPLGSVFPSRPGFPTPAKPRTGDSDRRDVDPMNYNSQYWTSVR